MSILCLSSTCFSCSAWSIPHISRTESSAHLALQLHQISVSLSFMSSMYSSSLAVKWACKATFSCDNILSVTVLISQLRTMWDSPVFKHEMMLFPFKRILRRPIGKENNDAVEQSQVYGLQIIVVCPLLSADVGLKHIPLGCCCLDSIVHGC